MTQEQKSEKPTLSVVIPCYYSEASLAEVVAGIAREIPAFCSGYEVLLVNDGSQDGTWAEIERLSAENPHVRGLNLMRNFGQHNALFAGILQTSGDYVVTMDDDLQHPPEELQKMLARLEEGFDVVYGTPQKQQHGWWRDFASVAVKKIVERGLNIEFASSISAFRIFRKELVKAFEGYIGPFADIDALLSWGTRKVAAVTVRHDSRKYGRSHYNLKRLFTHAIKLITSFSALPLRVASMLGFFFALFGLLSFFRVLIYNFLFGSVVQGFTFLASLISLLSGAQLFAIGILGEYMASVHFRSMGYPTAIVREATALTPLALAARAQPSNAATEQRDDLPETGSKSS